MSAALEPQVKTKFTYPLLRYMGSKYRLIPWIQDVFKNLEFESALDSFSGSGSVAYLLKTMGKTTYTNDFLKFPSLIAKAVIENSSVILSPDDTEYLLTDQGNAGSFIQDTFSHIFYTPEDLHFLDTVSNNIQGLDNEFKRALSYAALFRSCLKKQPRGVFTISGALDKYNDGRRDLRLSLQEHFLEQVGIYNGTVFSNGKDNRAYQGDVFQPSPQLLEADLVYMDPPYVPRSDDNDYIKRYHFLEGLASYWKDEPIMENTRVKKIHKKYTPFSYRRTAPEAFDKMFSLYRNSILVLSYSSNGYPDLDILKELMSQYKSEIEVHRKPHQYHFGTHKKVSRSKVEEYLIVGK